jgi:hypothetical protein
MPTASGRTPGQRFGHQTPASRDQLPNQATTKDLFAMKTLFAATAVALAMTTASFAADPPQRLSLNRASATDQITGVVVEGNSVVLVYGGANMASAAQALRITPNGNRIDVVYDTPGNLNVRVTGAPMMMMRAGGREFPVYNVGGQ